jgi:hypothetical protein
VAVVAAALAALVVTLRRVLLAVAEELLALAAPLAIPASLARQMLMLAVAVAVALIKPHILYRVPAVAAVALVADQGPARELVATRLITRVPAAAAAAVTLALAAMVGRVSLLSVIQTHSVILPRQVAS